MCKKVRLLIIWLMYITSVLFSANNESNVLSETRNTDLSEGCLSETEITSSAPSSHLKTLKHEFSLAKFNSRNVTIDAVRNYYELIFIKLYGYR